jgi:hypothetical protein
VKFILSVLAATLVATPALAGDIYRTVDKRGVVVYTDTPPYPGAKPIDIRAAPADERAAAERAAYAASNQAYREERAKARQESAAEAGDAAAKRAVECEQARQRAATYANAPRLYEDLPDGGRRYLTDAELSTAREESQQAVVRFCDGG